MICSRRHVAAVLVLALVACGEFRTALTDVTQLAAAIQSQFGLPVGVNIGGGTLVISIPGEAAAKIPTAQREAFSLAVARFAYAHYGHPATLARVGVQFVSRQDYGPLHVTRSDPGGSWLVGELSGPTTPAAVAHEGRRAAWIAIGDRNAPARLDVDYSRVPHDTGRGPDTIVVRVLYDHQITAPDGQRVASTEVHYQVTCTPLAYAMLGADAFDSTQRLVRSAPAGDLPAWMEPPGMVVARAAIPGYCRWHYPWRYNRSIAR
jgi:hypothetical protein